MKKLFRKAGGAGKLVSRYQAADLSRMDGRKDFGWHADVNQLIARSNPVIRERVRGLCRNFPPFVKAINAHCAFVVGKGGRFESQAVTKTGKDDKKLRELIEKRFNAWAETASIDSRMHFYECQQMALRQRLETGEFFCAFKIKDGRLGLQFIEPDNVAYEHEAVTGVMNNETVIYQGIEYNRYTGERLAYYITPYDPWGSVVTEAYRVDANEIIHGMQNGRPNQLRGVSPFAAAVVLADYLGDYLNSELGAAKLAAKWLAFVTAPDPKVVQFGKSKQHERDYGLTRIEELEDGIIEYLRTGEQINLANTPNRVTESFDRFTGFTLRMIGLVIGVPYEVISGDYQGINYSTSRMNRQDYNVLLEPERFWLNKNFNQPVFKEWLKYEALRSPEFFSDYFYSPERYEGALWIPAGMPSPDPQREGKADVEAIKAGLLAPQDVILARGDDPEKVLERRAKWKEMEEEHGLKSQIDEVSTMLQSNPAKDENKDENESENKDENKDDKDKD